MAGKDSVGAALRKAIGEPPVLPDVNPRPPGMSALLSERRRKVFLTVLDRPGIHLRELSRSIGVPLQSLSWHVDIMKKSGLLRAIRIGKFSSLCVTGQVEADILRDLALLDIVKNAAIIKVLKGRARTRSQVSSDLKIYPQAIDPSLRNLFVRGLISRDPTRVEFELGPRMREIVEHFRATQGDREARLLTLLASDGLAPEVVGRDEGKLDIEINGARRRVKVHANLMPNVIRVLGK